MSNTTPCNVERGEVELDETVIGIPLYRLDPPNRRGLLPRPDEGELVAAKQGAKVRCGGDALDPIVYRGQDRVSLFETSACDERMRVKGKRRRAVLMDAARSSAELTIDGDLARIEIAGPKVNRLRVVAWGGGERQRLALGKDGAATLPDGDRNWLRLRGRTKPGGVLATGNALIPR